MENKLITLLVSLFMLHTTTWAQPSTEVMALDLKISADSISVSNLKNISNHSGYDNQPSFLPNGNSIFYTSQQGDQTDVYYFDFMSGESQKITSSPGGEYSPTLTPDGNHFSTIILEASGRQLLWRYEKNGQNPQVLVPDLKIGYHCWLGNNLLAAFVLGEPSTLQLCDIESGETKILAENIGRSLHKIPTSGHLSYVDKSVQPWAIVSYDPATGNRAKITGCLAESEDMAWSSQGVLFMGKGSKLYAWHALWYPKWSLVADLETWGLRDITRLAVNQQGSRIAIVTADTQ